MKRATLLWITDPWATLDHANDTTLRLVQAARALGASCSWADVRSIRYEDGKTVVIALEVESVGPGRSQAEIRLGAPQVRPVEEFSQVFYRTDPPVDLAYLQPLQLLRLAESKKTNFCPPLSLLLQHNEKLEAHALKKLLPPTIATADRDALVAWGKREGTAVLKPLHQAQSKGVEKLEFGDSAAIERSRAQLDAATEGGRLPVVLQRYLPGIRDGETRLWFLDGKLLACVRKLPKTGQFRIDMDQGGTLAPHRLTKPEAATAKAIGRHLKRLRVKMAAVDLIDGYVTDFNFTSPGLIVGMEKVLGRDLATPIAKSLLKPQR